jgi:hypothetical protein
MQPNVGGHTTQAHEAYRPDDELVAPRWRLVVVCLLAAALASLPMRRVCTPLPAPPTGGTAHRSFGVEVVERGGRWELCEPWIRRALRD